MTDHETEPDATQTEPPLLDRDELTSVAILLSATVLAWLAFALRFFVQVQGETLNLLLVGASIAATLLILGAHHADRRFESICRTLFAFSMLLTLTVWTPGFAFPLMLVLPVIVADGLPGMLKRLGFRWQLEEWQRQQASPVIRESLPPEAGIHPPIGEIPSEESDPWIEVQNQFQVDPALKQNVAQWIDSDGNRCVVASLRCRFETPDETVVVQMPWWPVFQSTPDLHCRVVNGGDARIRVTRETPHGARLEIQLDGDTAKSALPKSVIIEVMAISENESTVQAA